MVTTSVKRSPLLNVVYNAELFLTEKEKLGKVHTCTVTEALYRLYGP